MKFLLGGHGHEYHSSRQGRGPQGFSVSTSVQAARARCRLKSVRKPALGIPFPARDLILGVLACV